MNKTLKTIAWICLALGVLGMAADAGVLIYGRKLTGERQAAFEEMRTEVQSGNIPNARNTCLAEDADKDGKPDGDCLKLQAPAQQGVGQPGIGGQPFRRVMMLKMRNNLDGRRLNSRGILPLFFLALGPILAVVGAVILLVNRVPKKVILNEKLDSVKTEKPSVDRKKG